MRLVTPSLRPERGLPLECGYDSSDRLVLPGHGGQEQQHRREENHGIRMKEQPHGNVHTSSIRF